MLALVAFPFGQAVLEVLYFIAVFFFGLFSLVYTYEMYENIRALKPEVQNAVHDGARNGFLKTAAIVGIIGCVVGLSLFFYGLAYHPEWFAPGPDVNPGGPGVSSGVVLQMSPASGPVGTIVTIASSTTFDATNTILLNGYMAAQTVVPSKDGSLVFAIPKALGPDCGPDQICPEFMIAIKSGVAYSVTVRSANGTSSAGMFTVTATSTAPKAPAAPSKTSLKK